MSDYEFAASLIIFIIILCEIFVIAMLLWLIEMAHDTKKDKEKEIIDRMCVSGIITVYEHMSYTE